MSSLEQQFGPHLVRYGTAADQKYLLNEFLGSYDGLVINASMLAHMPAALSAFIAQKSKKPYLIDPQTHAFQHEIDYLLGEKGGVKRSLKALISAYGAPIETRITDGVVVLPEDFEDTAVCAEFCSRVLRYQLREVNRQIQKGPDAKFLKFVARKKGIPEAEFSPVMLVAPYFYMTTGTYGEWQPVNERCVQASIEQYGSENKIAAQIVIAKDLLLQPNLADNLRTAYSKPKVRPAVFLVWVDSFVEEDADERSLIAYLHLLKALGSVAPVIVLYGGYFSTLICKCGVVPGLAAACHSLEYGESRAVLPVGGGVPVAKFYLRALHERLNFREALRAVRALGGFASIESYRSEVCDCDECNKIILKTPETDFQAYGDSKPVRVVRGGQEVTMQYPTAETKEHCVRHYMWCKQAEWIHGDKEKGAAVERLKGVAGRLKRTLGLDFVAHAETWSRVLEHFASE